MVKVIPFIYNDIDDLCANTYLVVDSDNSAIVIDPSVNNDKLSNYIIKNGFLLKGVLLTHGHFDHMRGVDILVNTFKCPLYIFYLDEEMLTNSYLNCSSIMEGERIVVDSKPITLKENDVLHLINEDINVIWTPFHTIGSVCYLFKESRIIFTGDTLFKSGFGRDDLPNSDRKSVRSSLKKLFSLDDEIKVYPGHGSFTKIKDEKALYNL